MNMKPTRVNHGRIIYIDRREIIGNDLLHALCVQGMWSEPGGRLQYKNARMCMFGI